MCANSLSRNFPFEHINSFQCYKLTRRCSYLLFRQISPLTYAVYLWPVHCECAMKHNWRGILNYLQIRDMLCTLIALPITLQWKSENLLGENSKISSKRAHPWETCSPGIYSVNCLASISSDIFSQKLNIRNNANIGIRDFTRLKQIFQWPNFTPIED